MKIIFGLSTGVLLLDKLKIIQNNETRIVLFLILVGLLKHNDTIKNRLDNEEKVKHFSILDLNTWKIKNPEEYFEKVYKKYLENEVKRDKYLILIFCLIDLIAIVSSADMSTAIPIINLLVIYVVLNKKYKEMEASKNILNDYIKNSQDIDKYELMSIICTLKYVEIPCREPRMTDYLTNQLEISDKKNAKYVNKLLKKQLQAKVERGQIPDE